MTNKQDLTAYSDAELSMQALNNEGLYNLCLDIKDAKKCLDMLKEHFITTK